MLHEWCQQRIHRLISLDRLVTKADAVCRVPHQPDKIASTHERELILQTLNEHSPTLREPLLLESLYGFSSQEVAGILAISWAAARQRLARAKEQLRRHYHRLDGDNYTPASRRAVHAPPSNTELSRKELQGSWLAN